MTEPVEHYENCNMCWEAEKQRQAELGLRCADCLEEFGRRPWITPSEDEPSLCVNCQRLAVYRATAPKTAGRYGSRGDV